MLETLKKALKIKEIRKRLLYTFVMLIVVRLGCQIAIPFVNADMVAEVTSPFKEGGFSFLSAITGGSLENMSIFALNITPYITASIIMQLLTIAIPKLDELQKDGEEGRKKIAEITRYLTVALALIESTAMIIGFANQGIFNTDSISYGSMSSLRKWGVVLTGIIAMTAGSAVLMWIGEQITEKGVGNGISIVLTINIISGMPSDISNLFTTFVTGEGKSIGMRILSALIIIGVIVGIVVLVVILQAATRNIAVQMSQKVQGRRQVGGQQSNIPLKVNTAGVIPIIFASSLLQFPVVIASFFGKQPEWANYLTQSHWCKPSQLKYSIGFVVYLLLVLFFAYFYTSIQYNPVEMANNLKANNGTVPGIRPGAPTADYIRKILSRITLIGAMFLAVIAMIPLIYGAASGMGQMSIGGTSIIIVVGVALETVKQLESQMMMRHYKGFLD
mgnify:CR=1 FL=1